MKEILPNNKKIILCHIVLLLCFSVYLVSADYLFDRMLIVNGESNIQDFTIPDKTDDIIGHPQLFQKNRLEWKEVILLSGYAFVKGQSMNGMKIYFVLKSNSSEYIYDTISLSRPDVTQFFYNGTVDLSNSGWRANIPVSVLGEDDYRIGFLIRNDTAKSFMMSAYYINKTGFYTK